MRKRAFSSMILSAFLAACLTVSVTGCGGSANTSGSSSAADTNSTASVSDSSTTDSNAASEQTSDTTEESKASETSAAITFPTENDVKVISLAQNIVPKTTDVFENYTYGSEAGNMRINVMLVQSDHEYFQQQNYRAHIRIKEGVDDTINPYREPFTYFISPITVGESEEYNTFLVILVSPEKYKLSDFNYTFEVKKDKFTLGLKDTTETAAFPEKLISDHVYQGYNVVRIDDMLYYYAGISHFSDGNRFNSSSNVTLSAHSVYPIFVRMDGSIEKKLKPELLKYIPDPDVIKGVDLDHVGFAADTSQIERSSCLFPVGEMFELIFGYEYTDSDTEEVKTARSKACKTYRQKGTLYYDDKLEIAYSRVG